METSFDKSYICFQNNSKWTLAMDEQIMTWARKKPADWEVEIPKEVFLWGSGSHGQLTELGTGIHEPELAPSFTQVRQIVCGQNCTFVIQGNGSVLSCGEGSYGRLGQGNSDDLASLTAIPTLSGWLLFTQLRSHALKQNFLLNFSFLVACFSPWLSCLCTFCYQCKHFCDFRFGVFTGYSFLHILSDQAEIPFSSWGGDGSKCQENGHIFRLKPKKCQQIHCLSYFSASGRIGGGNPSP